MKILKFHLQIHKRMCYGNHYGLMKLYKQGERQLPIPATKATAKNQLKILE